MKCQTKWSGLNYKIVCNINEMQSDSKITINEFLIWFFKNTGKDYLLKLCLHI